MKRKRDVGDDADANKIDPREISRQEKPRNNACFLRIWLLCAVDLLSDQWEWSCCCLSIDFLVFLLLPPSSIFLAVLEAERVSSSSSSQEKDFLALSTFPNRKVVSLSGKRGNFRLRLKSFFPSVHVFERSQLFQPFCGCILNRGKDPIFNQDHTL